jgi:photosystem II stability/assembly factor-like uncharacterized protein
MRLASFAFILLVACTPSISEKSEAEHCTAMSWNMDTSIRALEVVSDEEIWFAGANGMVGYTRDGGSTWNQFTLRLADGSLPSFRSLAATEDAVHVLTISDPAVLFRSVDGGVHWDSVYTEHHPDVFYDSMAFWDDKDGIAMGDAIGGCLSIILTHDGGATWNKLPCDQLPEAKEGEAAFAASNGNISVSDSAVWIVTGGKASRVFSSTDRGQNWRVKDAPVLQGGAMTGMFSLHMRDANHGIAWGGDWEDMENNAANKVITHDGGENWEPFFPKSGPGYRSSVRFVPNSKGQDIWAVGIPGVSRSKDGGHTWILEPDSSYFTVRFVPNGNCAWLAGKGIISRRPVNL